MTNDKQISSELSTLPLERLRSAVAISDWLLGGAREIKDANVILEGLSLKLNDAGVPIDRAISAVELRNSQQASNARIWERLSGAREHLFAHGSNNDEVAENSPVDLAHEKGEWVILDLDEATGRRYRFAALLREDGFRQHISIPVVLLNGMHNAFTFATKRRGGFSDDDIEVLRQVMPALAGLQEILAMHRVLREVMRMYVGNEPHLRILSGDVQRGEVLRIRAAILFADMRGYTQLTSNMTEEEATALVNEYYDCIVPAIHDRGGEILKFIGDGILAIFRVGDNENVEACWQAFAAARAGLAAVDQRSDDDATSVKFDVGIALHFGEPAYGNVGSGQRLDYTVIGRDVNLAARIAGMCGPLDQRLLLSAAFRKHLDEENIRSTGKHDLKGLPESEEIFAAQTG